MQGRPGRDGPFGQGLAIGADLAGSKGLRYRHEKLGGQLPDIRGDLSKYMKSIRTMAPALGPAARGTSPPHVSTRIMDEWGTPCSTNASLTADARFSASAASLAKPI